MIRRTVYLAIALCAALVAGLPLSWVWVCIFALCFGAASQILASLVRTAAWRRARLKALRT